MKNTELEFITGTKEFWTAKPITSINDIEVGIKNNALDTFEFYWLSRQEATQLRDWLNEALEGMG